MDKLFCFTEEQLLDFLCISCGCAWDRAREQQIIKLLNELAEKNEVTITYIGDTDEF